MPAARVYGHEDLLVWQRSMALAEEVYRLTEKLPGEERYGLTAQIRTAAVSVPANIAEGHGRHFPRDCARFAGVARGSLMELRTHLTLCDRLGFLPHADVVAVLAASDHVGRLLSAWRRALLRASST